jgi:cytochrome c oxidase cbb3-type subunit 3
MRLLAAVPASILAATMSCSGPDTADSAPPAGQTNDRVFAGGVAPDGAAIENPFEDDAQSITEGERLFGAMNCAECHGGPPVGFVGPSLVDGRWRYGGNDGSVFESIHSGRPKGMPAYGGLLPEDAIWKIVAYLRSQPVPEVVPTESWR